MDKLKRIVTNAGFDAGVLVVLAIIALVLVSL